MNPLRNPQKRETEKAGDNPNIYRRQHRCVRPSVLEKKARKVLDNQNVKLLIQKLNLEITDLWQE